MLEIRFTVSQEAPFPAHEGTQAPNVTAPWGLLQNGGTRRALSRYLIYSLTSRAGSGIFQTLMPTGLIAYKYARCYKLRAHSLFASAKKAHCAPRFTEAKMILSLWKCGNSAAFHPGESIQEISQNRTRGFFCGTNTMISYISVLPPIARKKW